MPSAWTARVCSWVLLDQGQGMHQYMLLGPPCFNDVGGDHVFCGDINLGMLSAPSVASTVQAVGRAQMLAGSTALKKTLMACARPEDTIVTSELASRGCNCFYGLLAPGSLADVTVVHGMMDAIAASRAAGATSASRDSWGVNGPAAAGSGHRPLPIFSYPPPHGGGDWPRQRLPGLMPVASPIVGHRELA